MYIADSISCTVNQYYVGGYITSTTTSYFITFTENKQFTDIFTAVQEVGQTRLTTETDGGREGG